MYIHNYIQNYIYIEIYTAHVWMNRLSSAVALLLGFMDWWPTLKLLVFPENNNYPLVN